MNKKEQNKFIKELEEEARVFIDDLEKDAAVFLETLDAEVMEKIKKQGK